MKGPVKLAVDIALREAARSPCRSKRGVVIYTTAVVLGSPDETFFALGSGHNGPPAPFSCPGREHCAGNCGQRSVHAEVRALRKVPKGNNMATALGSEVELVHVELAVPTVDPTAPPSGTPAVGVKPCGGPSCWQCSREILDAEIVDWVWLFEGGGPMWTDPAWRRYSPVEFHEATLRRCGMRP